jgi:hypothetical protein
MTQTKRGAAGDGTPQMKSVERASSSPKQIAPQAASLAQDLAQAKRYGAELLSTAIASAGVGLSAYSAISKPAARDDAGDLPGFLDRRLSVEERQRAWEALAPTLPPPVPLPPREPTWIELVRASAARDREAW